MGRGDIAFRKSFGSQVQKLIYLFVLLEARETCKESLNLVSAFAHPPNTKRDNNWRTHLARFLARTLVLQVAGGTASALVIMRQGITTGVVALRELRTNAAAKACASFGSFIAKFAVILDVAILLTLSAQ